MDVTTLNIIIIFVVFGLILLTLASIAIISLIIFVKVIKKPKKPITMDFENKKLSLELKMLKKLMGPDAIEFLTSIKASVSDYTKLNSEKIEILTDDNLTLRGKFIPAPNSSKKTVICLHGYKSTGAAEFMSIAPFLRDNNFNLLVVNHRAHGNSDGKYIGFGVLDHLDCLKWIEAVNKKIPDGEIVIYGISMGGATTLQTTSLNLPSNVKCAIADCPYTSTWDIIAHQMKYLFKISPYPLLPAMQKWNKLIAKYDYTTKSPLEAMAKAKIPVMIVHGDADKFVPAFMGKKCYEACTSEKELLIISQAGHAQSHWKDATKYEEAFISFTNKYIS